MVYMVPSMIELGKPDAGWRSTAHKTVCTRICICNPNVDCLQMMKDVCTAVDRVPVEAIEEVTYQQLLEVYGMPPVGLPE